MNQSILRVGVGLIFALAAWILMSLLKIFEFLLFTIGLHVCYITFSLSKSP